MPPDRTEPDGGPGTQAGPNLPVPAQPLPPQPLDSGRVADGRVLFENWRGDADKPAAPPRRPLPPGQRIGIALLGLEEILPAPVALISGSPQKAKAVAAQYGIAPERIFGYDDWDRIAADPAIDAVYVISPNGRHRDHVLAAAAAEAQEMVAACARAQVTLMIAYRCQYETFNRRAIDLVRSGQSIHVLASDSGPAHLRADRTVSASSTRASGHGLGKLVGYDGRTVRKLLPPPLPRSRAAAPTSD